MTIGDDIDSGRREAITRLFQNLVANASGGRPEKIVENIITEVNRGIAGIKVIHAIHSGLMKAYHEGGEDE